MAPPSIVQIAKEGFDLIDQFYGKNKPCTYHKPEIRLITEKPPLSSRNYVYQYPSPNPKPNPNPRTQDYVGGDNNNNRKRVQADAVPPKDMNGGEPMTAQNQYSGKWRNWNVGLTRF